MLVDQSKGKGMRKQREWDHMWNGDEVEPPEELLPPMSRMILMGYETRFGGSGARKWRKRYDKAIADYNRVTERLDTLIDGLEYTLECEDVIRQEHYVLHPRENGVSDKNKRLMDEMIHELKVERADLALLIHGLVCLVQRTEEVWWEPWDTMIKDKTNENSVGHGATVGEVPTPSGDKA
jgi:hypothetical protein